jgi:hypothetical protein
VTGDGKRYICTVLTRSAGGHDSSQNMRCMGTLSGCSSGSAQFQGPVRRNVRTTDEAPCGIGFKAPSSVAGRKNQQGTPRPRTCMAFYPVVRIILRSLRRIRTKGAARPRPLHLSAHAAVRTTVRMQGALLVAIPRR